MDALNPDDILRDAGGTFELEDDAAKPQTDATEPKPLRVVDPSKLEFAPVPRREWIVEDWLGIGYVTGQYGDGGVGKGMTAQCLQTATATGAPWLGRAVTPCRSVGLYCEDDDGELHRRQDRICGAMGVSYTDLGHMRWMSGVGHDNTLATFTYEGKMQVTERFRELEMIAREHEAKLIVLDNVADLYGGNENDRNQVRRFLNLLNRLAIDRGAAVLLNCHPSRSGMASGALDGGSTAWNNSMRSRWTLAKASKADDEADDGERILTRAKANYAPDGGVIRLRWASGVLVPVSRDGGVAGAIVRRAAEDTFLTLLDRHEAQGSPVSDSPNAANYAPKLFARRPDREGYRKAEFETAMNSLFAARRIRMTEYADKGRPRRKMERW